MDNTFQRDDIAFNETIILVLILILMDNTFQLVYIHADTQEEDLVLILILMDNTFQQVFSSNPL